MKGIVIAVIAILALFTLSVERGQAVTCGQVDAALVPCVDYLTGKEANPPPDCCAGVKAVKEMAQTPADKKTCCNCVKAAANGYAGLIDSAAQSLPAKCYVQLGIPISRSVDCDKIPVRVERDEGEGAGELHYKDLNSRGSTILK